MKNSKPKIDYGKLQHVLIVAIRKLIYEKVKSKDEISKRYSKHFKRKEPQNIEKALQTLSKDKLIKFVKSSIREIRGSDIDELYEEYYYGGKPKFQLYSIYELPALNSIREDFKSELLKFNEELLKDADEEHPPIFRNFQFDDLINLEKEGIIEIKYKFESRYNYISPVTEESDTLYELKHSFIWINKRKSYCAIHASGHNAAIKMAEIIRNCEIKIKKIKLTKEIMNGVFSLDKIQRASYYKTKVSEDEFERIRLSDKNLGSKTRNLIPFEKGYVRTGALYKEKIANDLESFVGVVGDTGEIYLTRTLKTSQLRIWATDKISRIIDLYNNFERSNINTLVELNSLDKHLNQYHLNSDAKTLLYQIAGRFSSESGLNSTSLDLPKHFDAIKDDYFVTYTFYCEKCQNKYPLTCSKCLSEDFEEASTGKYFRCNSCNQMITRYKDYLICPEGHSTLFEENIKDLRILIPKPRLLEILRNLSIYIPDFNYDFQTQGFYLNGDQLIVSNPSSDTLLQVKDFPSLKKYRSNFISEKQKETFLNLLRILPEKPDGVKTSDDFVDYKQEESIRCLIKVLHYAVGVKPKPHHGHEFGDIMIDLKYKGNDVTLQGICKAYSKGPYTSGNMVGRTIIGQALGAFTDATVNIVAIITPTEIDDGLKATLKFLARTLDKKLIYFDENILLNMLITASEITGLQPAIIKKSLNRRKTNAKTIS